MASSLSVFLIGEVYNTYINYSIWSNPERKIERLKSMKIKLSAKNASKWHRTVYILQIFTIAIS